MERHDRAPGSHDCGHAQITQTCAHTGGTLTRQPTAPNGGSARVISNAANHSASSRLALPNDIP
jgi:hypothetical protein